MRLSDRRTHTTDERVDPPGDATPGRATLPYNPALDGVRAIAVVAVLLYHAGVGEFSGGFLGVDVFFTLSGFLITTLLLLERDSTRRIDVVQFWLRRAKRLLPALFLVLAAVVIYAAFFAHDSELARIRGDTLASLFYVANWRFVFSGQSYFAQYTTPSPLRHTWSLAIEEQWYLVWPLLVAFAMARGWARSRMAIATLIAALGSAAVMIWLHAGAADPSRAYYGTDSRAQALLVGSALAFALNGKTIDRVPHWLIEAVTGAALTGIVAMIILVNDSQDFVFRGGFLLLAVLTALLLAGITQPTPTAARLALSVRPLAAVGAISYGLYLWHWPLFVFLSPERTGIEGIALLALRLATTAALATLSYRLVEMPIRRGLLGRTARRVADQRRASGARPALSERVLLAGGVASVTIVLIGLLTASTRSGSAAEDFAAAMERLARPGAVKVLVVGDSIPWSLAYHYRTMPGEADVTVRSMAIPGCGLLDSEAITGGVAKPFSDDCRATRDSFDQTLQALRPEIVLLAPGAIEAYDQRTADGRIIEFGTPAHRALILAALEEKLPKYTATGAKVVLLTTPCLNGHKAGQAPRADPEFVEHQDPQRIRILNGIWGEFAKKHPRQVTLIDLRSHLCPRYEWQAEKDGVELQTDGVHFTEEGAWLVWRWLMPQLNKIAGRS